MLCYTPWGVLARSTLGSSPTVRGNDNGGRDESGKQLFYTFHFLLAFLNH